MSINKLAIIATCIAGLSTIIYVGLIDSYGTPIPESVSSIADNVGGSATLRMNINDDRYMVGGCHYVFVGKVLRQTGIGIMIGAQSSAQFGVEVISNIKGELNGVVTIAQMGAWVTKTGKPSFFFNDDGYLNIGATYLFATRYEPQTHVYEIWTPGYDRKLLTGDASLSTRELGALADRDERVQAFKEAYPHEILGAVDRKRGTTWNSYESLHSGHLFTPPPFVSEATNAPVTQSPAPSEPQSFVPSTSAESTPSASESVEPSMSAEPIEWPTVTPPAESTSPSPADESPTPTPSPTEVSVES